MADRRCDGGWRQAETPDREGLEAGEGSPTPWPPVRASNGRGERRVVVRRRFWWCVVGDGCDSVQWRQLPVVGCWQENETSERENKAGARAKPLGKRGSRRREKARQREGFTYIYKKKLIHPPILNIINLSFIH